MRWPRSTRPSSLRSSPNPSEPGVHAAVVAMSGAPGTVAEALRHCGIEPMDARLLLQHVRGVSHAQLMAHADRALDEAQRIRFGQLVQRRAQGEPIAYLLGWREFYGRRFEVGPAVLIPRPETELLVDLALERIDPGKAAQVLDLGTGSGNIALTLALERPDCTVTAVDASTAALAIAKRNGAALGATRVEWLTGDWFALLADRCFDLIVSNPPYVAEHDPHLREGDLRFEPPTALRAGADGLAAIRRIVADAPGHLRPGGWLLFEHGHDQAPGSRQLLADAGLVDLVTERDLAGMARVSGGKWKQCGQRARPGTG